MHDVEPSERAALWQMVMEHDALFAEQPAPCSLSELHTNTDGEGSNVLVVYQPEW